MKVQTSLKSGQNVAGMIVAAQSPTSTVPAGSSNPLYSPTTGSGTNPLYKN